MSVDLQLAGASVENVLHVPRQAVFDRNGKPVVYVRAGDRFEPREVKPTHRSETRVAMEGVEEGTEVALVNPEAAVAGTPTAAAPPTAVGK
jgi:hypothetical protein